MTKNTNLTQKILKERKDGLVVTSSVLNQLPDSVELKQESACHVCPNAVWFTESTERKNRPNLSVFCRIMNSVIWQTEWKTDRILIQQCDGMLIDDSQNEE
ncbi:Uncharacterised protein [Escherichia coli]|nr:Uncharacterised protein [Escherichia coli]